MQVFSRHVSPNCTNFFIKGYKNKVTHYWKKPICKRIKNRNFPQSEIGFSLVEALVALLIMTIVFSVAGPLFINQRLQNINSEIRTGAIALSQQILDALKQVDPSTIPKSGSVTLNTNLTSSAPSTSNVLNVSSVSGFVVGQSLVVGSDSGENIIQSINSVLNKITLTSALGTNQPAGASVKVTSIGYPYDVTIQYCPNASFPCGTSSRNVRVQVNYNGNTVYTVETVYTQLK